MEGSPFEKLESLSDISGGDATVDNYGNYYFDRGYDGYFSDVTPSDYSMAYQDMFGGYFDFNPWMKVNNSWAIYAPPVYYDNFDPWPRDANGNLIMTYTGNHTYNYGVTGGLLIMGEYTMDLNGYTFKLYNVDLVYEYSNGLRVPTPSERSNCFGYAAELDGLWFADNVSTPDDESLLFNTYVNMFYEECTESEAELIVLYEDAEKTDPYHAAIRNSDDTYSYKPGAEGLVENQCILI